MEPHLHKSTSKTEKIQFIQTKPCKQIDTSPSLCRLITKTNLEFKQLRKKIIDIQKGNATNRFNGKQSVVAQLQPLDVQSRCQKKIQIYIQSTAVAY